MPNRPRVRIKRPLYRAKELGANKTAPQVEGRGFDGWTGNPSEDNQSSLETRGEQTRLCAVEKDPEPIQPESSSAGTQPHIGNNAALLLLFESFLFFF